MHGQEKRVKVVLLRVALQIDLEKEVDRVGGVKIDCYLHGRAGIRAGSRRSATRHMLSPSLYNVFFL